MPYKLLKEGDNYRSLSYGACEPYQWAVQVKSPFLAHPCSVPAAVTVFHRSCLRLSFSLTHLSYLLKLPREQASCIFIFKLVFFLTDKLSRHGFHRTSSSEFLGVGSRQPYVPKHIGTQEHCPACLLLPWSKCFSLVSSSKLSVQVTVAISFSHRKCRQQDWVVFSRMDAS